ncbi:hypothetical protein [Pseudobutyrivibrio xylanivorans]|uniref:Uncharacterized protein n=1 Tax=Pseudobutyrivibrio xylanivorans DSM 14809 TaxID=1123012 RepID=A0A1M6A6J1_PSEXY|nr:hypothetical protein [Pseudobutyrivibrio xylanivorans]SHI31773.1 hypothetical protein SAMN02745725_00112 [Pseudobutyrivibrio xylanivorans DSM 14809]
MVSCRDLLEKQLNELDKLISKSNKNISKLENLPDYSVIVSISNGCKQYYLYDRTTGKKEYANSKKMKLVKKIAQRDYELIVNKKLNVLRGRINRFLSGYHLDDIGKIYDDMHPVRRELLVPFIEPDEAYIQRWLEENPDHQNDFYGNGKIATANGGYVRSKSERIIADLLDKYHVPYRYEPRLELVGRHIVYPDFMVLNVRKRKTLYWEHLGLLSEYSYAQKNFTKINDYEEGGLLLGKNLIITMETEEAPINTKLVEEKIKLYCL